MKGTINRDLRADENYSGGPLVAGMPVYEYIGCTYGCIAPGGIAVSVKEGETPFFEVPEDSVTWERAHDRQLARATAAGGRESTMKRKIIETLIFAILLAIHEAFDCRSPWYGSVLGFVSFVPLYWMAVLRYRVVRP